VALLLYYDYFRTSFVREYESTTYESTSVSIFVRKYLYVYVRVQYV
jgi:hypothetical protein